MPIETLTDGSSWRVIGESVRGATHERAGTRNQDAIAWSPASGFGPPLILALADGHGSARYVRSHIGARFAVEVALEVLGTFPEELNTPDNRSDQTALQRLVREIRDQLPQRLVRRWQQKVLQHWDVQPLTTDEMQHIERQRGTAVRQEMERAPLRAYGATLLTVAVLPTALLYLQLGDGDILTVSPSGQVARPLPHDERLIGNETTSLCSRDAWHDVRLRLQLLDDQSLNQLPALILAATDGYSNSFADEAGFMQVGSDLLDLARIESMDSVQSSLETWLTEASQMGSGDDITLGIIGRIEALASDGTSGAVSEPTSTITKRADTAAAEQVPAEKPDYVAPDSAIATATNGTPADAPSSAEGQTLPDVDTNSYPEQESDQDKQ
jgi:hypothetical protein